MKLISIIVPIYNVEEYLERCIRSIFHQTYQNYELILVDDGSLDHSGEMCDQFAREDKRIKVIHKENGGLSDARNAGLRVAQGEYVAFVDSDDWLSVYYLKSLYEAAEKTGSDIVECEIVKTSKDAENEDIGKAYEMKQYNTQEALKNLIMDHIFHQYVWNKLYKRDAINSIFFEKGKINEDEFWTYQIFGNANKVTKINTPLYYYFQRETSIMGSGYNIRRLDAIEAKVNRQKYIEKNFPDLALIAKENLIGSCIYAGQMILKYIDEKNKKEAMEKINGLRCSHKLTIKELRKISDRSVIWLILSKISFWGTCKIKNKLSKGF